MFANPLAFVVLMGLACSVACTDEYRVKYTQLESAQLEEKDAGSVRILTPRVMPGLKGQQLSSSRVHLAPCSINWPHTHTHANELLYVKYKLTLNPRLSFDLIAYSLLDNRLLRRTI